MTTNFETRAASIQNSFDIFTGQWCSNVPLYGSGSAQLFFDERIKAFDSNIGGFAGKKVLELGPLEAGHTYAMTLLGASDILAIEGNKDAFLRCLVVKEAFKMDASFLCGDFEKYLENSPPRFDVVVACGILYHMKDPLKIIRNVASIADQICIWTHFYDHEITVNNHHLKQKFSKPETVAFNGTKIEIAKQSYLTDVQRLDFAGGMEEYSYWVSLDGLKKAFDSLGFTTTILDIQRQHPHGAGVTFVAKRR